MIASGLLFWMRDRIKRGGSEPATVRLVRELTVGSVTGVFAAIAVFLVTNRLLPHEAGLLGYDRSDLEVWAFMLVWAGALAHAALRDKAA